MGIFDWLFNKKNVNPTERKGNQSSTQTIVLDKPSLSVSTIG